MTPPPANRPTGAVRTIAGLILMAIGASVMVYAIVHTVRGGGAPGWPLTVSFLVPLVLGALIAFTDEVQPSIKDVLARFTFTKGG